MENSAYMPTSLASPALMVLASTAEASREALHMQGTPAFPGQTMESKDMHIPFTASSFTMRSVYGQPDGFPSLPAHLLHLHNPFLTPAMERSLGFINTTGSGAFRPVAATTTTASDDRNGFHSAFVPTTAKGSKLEASSASYPHSVASDCNVTFSSHIGRMSPQGVKEESSDRETSSSLDLQDRLTGTPASDVTDGTERSTPDEGRALRRWGITSHALLLGAMLGEEAISRTGAKKRPIFDCQGCCCPVCGVTLRSGEVELHFQQEADRLNKISRVIKKSSKDSPPQKSSPGNSNKKNKELLSCSGEKNTPESRWESYQRVKSNRHCRLSARAKGKKRKQLDETTCPVCNERLTGTPEELNAHAEQCLRKREADGDEDEQVDVEGETFEEYEWAGQTRIRATSLLQGGFAASGFQTSSSRSLLEDQDIDLNVDGDDTDTYGQPQYNEADVIPCSTTEPGEDKERQALRGALVGHPSSGHPNASHWSSDDESMEQTFNLNSYTSKHDASSDQPQEGSNNSAASTSLDAALVVESLKTQVKELEAQCNLSSKFKCLICMGPYAKPLASVSCWHVHCEDCWLRTLGAKKLCPQCNMITSPQDLRRIYL